MSNEDTKCIFCKIIRGEDEKSKILFEDDEFAVFNDYKPASKLHYLVCTKQHIPDPKVLKKSDLPLVERMVETGKQMVTENGGDLTDSRFGFHWPPFNSIRHLHLHVISPQSQMGWIARAIFKVDSFWFVSDKWLIERLKSLEE